MSVSIILQKLQDKLLKNYNLIIQEDIHTETDSSWNGTPPDVNYITHQPTVIPKTVVKKIKIKQKVKEADQVGMENEKEEEIEKDYPENTNPPPSNNMSTGEYDGNVGAGDPGYDMNMMGIPQEEEKDPTEIGRIYELKKIYSRLTAMEGYLADTSDPWLLEVRNYVAQAIELFEVVSSNFNSYKDKLDEIVITYYKFIKEVYEHVKDYYRKQSTKKETN